MSTKPRVVSDFRTQLLAAGVVLAQPPKDQKYEHPIAQALAAGTQYPDNWAALEQSMPITPGLTLLFGGTAVGKTVLSVKLAFALKKAGIDVTYLTYAEPEGVSDAFIAEADVAAQMQTLTTKVVIVDSLRLVPYDLTGAAKSGGVSTGLFRYLTELDIAATNANIAVIALMNPLSGEDVKLEMYLRDVESSVMAIAKITGVEQGTYKHRRYGRREQPLVVPSVDLDTSTIADDDQKLSGSVPNTSQPQTGMKVSVLNLFND